MVFFINEQYLGLVGDNMSLEKKIKEKDKRIEKLEELLKECGNGLDKIKHIAKVKNLAAVYQVAERTLARIEEVLK